ncbi:MAG: Kelch repeat-containing protein, partial [Acidiferrobacterales bacterium]
DGKVLIAGGKNDEVDGLQSAEIYDPATGLFTPTGDMLTVRYNHTATLLNSGKVLIVGGAQGSNNPIASAEIYNPVTGTFQATGSMAIARADHTATLLADGKVLITGGRQTLNDASALDTAEIYDPASGTFSNAGSVGSAHTDHTATLLQDGKVLIVGGFDGTANTSNAELYIPH